MFHKYRNKIIISVLFLAAFVRLLGIIAKPIWYDEAIAMLLAEKGVSAMLYGTISPAGAGSANVHPLGYHILLWIWMNIFGESVVSARMLSILAGVITVYLIYLITLEVFKRENIALTSAVFTSLAPFQVHYSQEIRMYALMAMWVLLATYAYQRGTGNGNWKWWILFSVSTGFAQYTHHLASFYLVALALWPVIQRDWKTSYKLFLAGIGALIIYSPWAIYLPAQFSKVQNAYWVARPDITKLFNLVLTFIPNIPLPDNLIAPALFASLAIVIIGMVQTVTAIRKSTSKDGLWLFYISFTPPMLLFLFSQWTPVYVERALLPSGAIFCIWLAWAITGTNLSKFFQYPIFGILLLLATIGIHQHVTKHGFPYGPYKEISISLRERVGPDDVIVHANKMTILPVMYFDRSLDQKFLGDPQGSVHDTFAPATQQVLGVNAEKDIKSAVNRANRVWFISFQRDIPDPTSGEERNASIKYLNSNYKLESVEKWDGLQIFIYTKEP